MIELWPHQISALAKIHECLRNNQESILIQLPTGSGKTVIFSRLIADLISKWGIRVIVLMHRRILVEQTSKILQGFGDFGDKVVIQTIQTAVNRDYGKFNLVIIDEVHRLPPRDVESQYLKFLETINHDKLKLLGVTATPYRLKQGYLHEGPGAFFKGIDYSLTLNTLIGQGYLCPMRYKVLDTGLDLTGIRRGADGDFAPGQLGEEMIKVNHLKSVSHAISRYAGERKRIAVFCVNIAHCDAVAEIVGGTAFHSKNKAPMPKFGTICSVGSITEGWDDPTVDCIVMARPTMSPALYVQMIGRGLRILKNKDDCMILDLVGNFERHGDPSDPEVKGTGGGQRLERICPQCGTVNLLRDVLCVECGFDMREERAAIKKREEENRNLAMKEIKTQKVYTIEDVTAESFMTRNGQDYLRVFFKTSGGKVSHIYPKNARSKFDGGNWPHRKFGIIGRKCFGDSRLRIDHWELFDLIANKPLLSGNEVKIVKQDGTRYKKIVGF